MSTRFSVRTPSGQEHVISGPFRIGRDPECQIQLDNNLVSRIHASIWIDHDHLLLRDERSRNGTRLNGQALAPGEMQYLHHGDEVRIGDTTLVVESDPPYPRPPQHRGLPGEPEYEPPPTADLKKPSLPADNPPPGPAPTAPTRRSPALYLAAGGCLVLALLSVCCVLGFFAVTAGGPAIKTILAPPVQRTATPGAAAQAGAVQVVIGPAQRTPPPPAPPTAGPRRAVKSGMCVCGYVGEEVGRRQVKK